MGDITCSATGVIHAAHSRFSGQSIKGIVWELSCYKNDQDLVDSASFELTFPVPIPKDKVVGIMRAAMRRYLDGQITEKENGSDQEAQSGSRPAQVPRRIRNRAIE